MSISIKEWVENDYWISNPEHRKERLQKIYSKNYLCPQCNKVMKWHSDHLTFIWFECYGGSCSGEGKVYL